MLSARGLQAGHPGAPAGPALDLEIAAGAWVALSGPNGAGKTALLLTLAGLLPARSGTLLWKGESLEAVRGAIGVVLQDTESQLLADTVAAEVALPLEHLGWPRPRITRRVQSVLAEFELTPWSSRSPSQLSAGEQARLALAAAIASEPELLLLDEPEASLDAARRAWIVEWLARWTATGRAAVVATQVAEIWKAAGRRIWLDGAGLAACGVADRLGAAAATPLLAESGRAGALRFYSVRPAHETQQAPLVSLEDVAFRHEARSDAPWLLEGVQLRLHAGETLLVRGPNGSGKTTLLCLAAGLLEPARGRAAVGLALASRSDAARFGVLLQSPEDQLVGETVLDDLLLAGGNPQRPTARALARARTALEVAGLDPDRVLARSPAELSAGERRRVAWAGLQLLDAGVWILDEPTAGLDDFGTRVVAESIKRFNTQGGATLVATQDARLAAILSPGESPAEPGSARETRPGRAIPQPVLPQLPLDLNRT